MVECRVGRRVRVFARVGFGGVGGGCSRQSTPVITGTDGGRRRPG